MRRYLLTPATAAGAAIIGLLCALAVAKPPEPGGPPGLKPFPKPERVEANPDSHARLAAWFLSSAGTHRRFPPGSECCIRFVSWVGIPADRLERTKLFFAWLCNQMSFTTAPNWPRDVPGSSGRLQWLNLRWFRWSPDAWAAVAGRDKIFRTPPVFDDVGDYLRRAVGATHEGGYDTPVEAVVWGGKLVRDAIETDRVPTYYDLLFSRQRFGDWNPARGAAAEGGGLKVAQSADPEPALGDRGGMVFDLPEGATLTLDGELQSSRRFQTPALGERGGTFDVVVESGTRTAKAKVKVFPGRRTTVTVTAKAGADRGKSDGFVDKNFPRDEDDWQKAFGIDLAKAFGADQKLLLQYGAVVRGNRNDTKAGSMVALNDRLMVLTPGVLPGMQTYDAFVTAGKRDFFEQATRFPVAFKTNQEDKVVVFDAGELLNYLPNGGQAGFLIDGKRKRAEIAASKAASAKNADPHLNPGVRNPGDCYVCHGPLGGFITPRNLVKRALEAGVSANFKDPDDEEDYRGFFLGWEKRADTLRGPYFDLLNEVTRPHPPDPAEWEEARACDDVEGLKALAARAAAVKNKPGWDGKQLALEVNEFRHWYDAPVDAAQASAEFGLPEAVFKGLAAKVEFYAKDAVLGEWFDGRTGNPALLNRGLDVPREAWDADVVTTFAKVLSLERRGRPSGQGQPRPGTMPQGKLP